MADGHGKIRILLVNSTLHIGGAEKVVADLCRSIDRNRYEVTVCHLKECGVVGESLREEGFRVIGLPVKSSHVLAKFTAIWLLRLLRSERFDIVHSHCIHSFMDIGFCRLLYRKCRYIHTFHFGNYPHRPAKYRRYESILWHFPDRLVAVGETQKKALQATYGIPDDRLVVVRNGVAVPEQVACAHEYAPIRVRGKLVIGTIGTLIEQKGHQYLIEAARILRNERDDFVLVIAGGGRLHEQLEGQVAEYGLQDTVILAGWVDQAQERILGLFDIFVQSSLWEAMSVVVLEAMAAARPVLATTAGENDYVIEHGRSGLLMQPGDARAIADGLRRLLDDAGLRRALGEAGRARVETCFSLESMAAGHDSLYRECLGETGGRS